MKPTKEDLLELAEFDSYGHSPWRWGYHETRVYEWDDESYWALDVEVTSGDMGGITAYDEPYEVEKIEVTTYEWKKK